MKRPEFIFKMWYPLHLASLICKIQQSDVDTKYETVTIPKASILDYKALQFKKS